MRCLVPSVSVFYFQSPRARFPFPFPFPAKYDDPDDDDDEPQVNDVEEVASIRPVSSLSDAEVTKMNQDAIDLAVAGKVCEFLMMRTYDFYLVLYMGGEATL